jgi:hypothetical protein
MEYHNQVWVTDEMYINKDIRMSVFVLFYFVSYTTILKSYNI